MDLFLRQSKLLRVAAADLLPEEAEGDRNEPLARKVAGLAIAARTGSGAT